MSKQQIFRFSLGPVQGFLGEARRTRDYWAGSFLLSFLSAHAIAAAREQGADILSPNPAPADPLLEAVCAHRAGRPILPAAYDPSLPNQFRAHVDRNFDPALCRDAVFDAWKELTSAVAALLDTPLERHTQARAIWEAQTARGTLWEVLWVLGPADVIRPDDEWLAQRKQRRQPASLSDTGLGDRCAQMAAYRELSGCNRSLGKGRDSQDTFWHDVREAVELKRRYETLDVRQSERLCAPALVKRLFPVLGRTALKAAIGWVPPDFDETAPYAPLRYWPSTAAIAAHGWLRMAHAAPAAAERKTFVTLIAEQSPKHSKAEAYSRLWDGQEKPAGALDAVDGKLLFPGEYDNPRLCEDLGTDPDSLARALKALKALQNRPRDESGETLGAPSPYYAVLKMDGDHAGKVLSHAGGQDEEAFGKALNIFSNNVRALFRPGDHGAAVFAGDVLYAGADDVLAILPVESVLGAALRIREEWTCIMGKAELKGAVPTISAGIVIARYSIALGWVMREAARLLDAEAKEAAGRNAVAIRVMRSNGDGPMWRGAWDRHATGPDEKPDAAQITAMLTLIKATRAGAPWGRNRLIYGLDARLGGMVSSNARALSFERVKRLIAAEALDVQGEQGSAGHDARGKALFEQAELAAQLTLPFARGYGERGEPCCQLDGLLIVKMLCEEWRGAADG